MTTANPKRKSSKHNVTEQTGEQLLLRYRETGDREAFAQIVQMYEHELYNYLHRYMGSAEMAEDAFQATFLQVHLKCEQFDRGRRLRPWLYAIATNQAIDAQRRNKRHRMASLDQTNSKHDDELGKLMDLLVSAEPDPVDVVDAGDNQQWVRDEISTLPDHLRSVVGLVYFQGMKYREAAEALAIPVGTVKSRLHAAVLKLNQAWHASHVQRN
ncbi:MAG: RNA polymerase sigma factor [Planctomycetaceae bacterium]|nr:RNA polymerase sigma factor [Planctomycetaceae bacterium]